MIKCNISIFETVFVHQIGLINTLFLNLESTQDEYTTFLRLILSACRYVIRLYALHRCQRSVRLVKALGNRYKKKHSARGIIDSLWPLWETVQVVAW